jgi:hypothetical protein
MTTLVRVRGTYKIYHAYIYRVRDLVYKVEILLYIIANTGRDVVTRELSGNIFHNFCHVLCRINIYSRCKHTHTHCE